MVRALVVLGGENVQSVGGTFVIICMVVVSLSVISMVIFACGESFNDLAHKKRRRHGVGGGRTGFMFSSGAAGAAGGGAAGYAASGGDFASAGGAGGGGGCGGGGGGGGGASLEPSYALRALGVDEDMAHTSIRFGIGRFTTEEEVDRAVELTVKQVEKLREMSPLYEMAMEGIDVKKIE